MNMVTTQNHMSYCNGIMGEPNELRQNNTKKIFARALDKKKNHKHPR